MPCCGLTKNEAYKLFTFAIWMEVCCGLVAVLLFGFFDGHNREVLLYVIFVLDWGFGLWLFCFTLMEISSRIKKCSITSPKLNRLFLVSTIVTFSVFYKTFRYKHVLPEHKEEELETGFRLLIAFVYELPLIYLICSAAPFFKKPFPCIIYVIWIQMGAVLTLTNLATASAFHHYLYYGATPNAWAYAIFSVDLYFASVLFFYIGYETRSPPLQNIFKKPGVSFFVCVVTTVAISVAFGLFWAQNTLVLWQNGIPKLVTNVLGFYIYSVYLITLLQCKPGGIEENAVPNDIEITPVRV